MKRSFVISVILLVICAAAALGAFIAGKLGVLDAAVSRHIYAPLTFAVIILACWVYAEVNNNEKRDR
ncbi:MAG: hypothetical protein IKT99_02645 [Oscillospiraceae bacterium]|nr:hypothetical protein [Oscillospiraceae bacterium]